MAVFCGVAALAGHLFPIYLNFKGGKGVATGAGVLFAMNWIAGAVAVGIFVLVFLPFRYVSLGSMFAAVSVPVTQYLTGRRFRPDSQEQWVFTIFCIILAITVIAKHRDNIRRLRRGEEKRFSLTKPGAEPSTVPNEKSEVSP